MKKCKNQIPSLQQKMPFQNLNKKSFLNRKSLYQKLITTHQQNKKIPIIVLKIKKSAEVNILQPIFSINSSFVITLISLLKEFRTELRNSFERNYLHLNRKAHFAVLYNYKPDTLLPFSKSE